MTAKKVKLYIFDTSVPVQDPMALNLFGENIVVIPSTVIEELNTIKDDVNQLRGLTAQIFLKELDRLTLDFDEYIETGIPLENGGTLKIELNHKSLSSLKGAYDKEINDNRIIAVAKNYSEKLTQVLNGEVLEDKIDLELLSTVSEVILVSNDVGLRVKARTVGVKAEGYESDRVVHHLDEVYKGFKNVFVDEHCMFDFFKYGTVNLEALGAENIIDVYVNEFIIMKNPLTPSQSAIGRVSGKEGKLCIKKLIMSNEDFIYGIKALDSNQLMALELLMDPEVKLVNLIGKAGTGKTLLALAAGLHQLENGLYKRVLALRTLVVVGKKEVGFLPGDLNDKLKPFMMPIYDNLEFLFEKKKKDTSLEKMLEDLDGKLVVESTGFMRGRTLPGQFIVVDEAQNLTKHEVKTLVTRIGEGGKIVLMGDPNQIDDPYLDSVNNGLIYETEKMKDLFITGTVFLTGKSKRSLLAELASERL